MTDGSAEEDPLTDDRMVIKREGSHQLLLPEDWPIEQKEGYLAPAGIEEYLSMKFGQVRNKFSQTDAKMAGLEKRIVALEQENRELLKAIQLIQGQLTQKEAGDGD